MIDVNVVVTNRASVSYFDSDFDKAIIDDLTIENPAWRENDIHGRWNGNTPQKLRYYELGDLDALFVPRGYLYNLKQKCRERKLSLLITRKVTDVGVDFKFAGELKPFQQPAVDTILQYPEGVLNSPTGSGKTVMALYMIAERKQKTLIIVHTKELLHQWIDRIYTFLSIPKEEIGIIGAGKLFVGPRITVSLIQTLHKRADPISEDFGHVIVDECHRVPSKTFTKGVDKFNPKFILGLSATPYRNDGLTKLIGWHIGPIRYEIDTKDLIKEGHISPIRYTVRRTDYIPNVDDPSSEYTTMVSDMTKDEERNELIADDVYKEVTENNTCLVLSDRKPHCRLISDILVAKYQLSPEILTGDTPKDERENIVKRVNAGTSNILIATGQLIGEGFDCNQLNALFLTTPVKYSGRVIQYVGRVLRPTKGKDYALIYDYLDVNIKIMFGSFNKRVKVYKELGVPNV